MAEQIDFEEVESGNSGASETAKEAVDVPEKSFDEKDDIHCYLVFSEEISVEEGTELVRQQITGGQELKLERIDTGGNAVVVILTPEQYKRALELPEIESITIMEEVELTENALPEKTSEEESTGVIEGESEVSELTTEYSTKEYETEEMTTESLIESTADSQKSFLDENVKGLRIVAIIVVVIVLLVIYVQQKKRW